MNVAIAKPDYGAVGGFELVVQRLADGLRQRGHSVDLVQVDATASPTSHLSVTLTEHEFLLFKEFFAHLNLVARFEELDVARYDAVLCTQPASYAVRHPRKVLLFYHHARSFYDLQDLIEEVRGHDVDLHRLASAIVRDVDAYHLHGGVRILAGSRRVKERIGHFNELHGNVEIFSAGVDADFLDFQRPLTFESPLCVGRHEFPKRTELFIHAMYHANGPEGRLLGAGTFTDRLKGMDAWLRLRHAGEPQRRRPGTSACRVDDRRMWREHTIHLPPDALLAAQAAVTERGLASRVHFLGRLSQEDLLGEYASALCIVCPAFDEDYGLTCLEAMACGKPVIACLDGGGYVELIDDGVDGFLVEPTGPAIAEAIERCKDRDLARRMGARGREKARAYTWDRAINQVERALSMSDRE